MERYPQFWRQRRDATRSDAEPMRPLSTPAAVESVRDEPLFLRTFAFDGVVPVQPTAEQSLDPNDSSGWIVVASTSGSTVNNSSAAVGECVAGSTVRIAPYVRFRGDIALTLPGENVVWGAGVALRA